jgi:hypothetical protein
MTGNSPEVQATQLEKIKPQKHSDVRQDELESVKRTLYNAIDKLDRIQRQRDAELITT